MSDRVTLGIDRTGRDGHGVCADLVPEIIELDDWGYPIIHAGAIPASVMPHAPSGRGLSHARAAPSSPQDDALAQDFGRGVHLAEHR